MPFTARFESADNEDQDVRVKKENHGSSGKGSSGGCSRGRSPNSSESSSTPSWKSSQGSRVIINTPLATRFRKTSGTSTRNPGGKRMSCAPSFVSTFAFNLVGLLLSIVAGGGRGIQKE